MANSAIDRNYTAICQKCGKVMKGLNFYKYRDGTPMELCKKCLTMHVDSFDESTFLWLLEKADVPYIKPEWDILRDRAFAKNPNKVNGMSVFGRYLSKMRLTQWRDYHWSDTEELSKNYLREVEANKEQFKEIKQKTEEILDKYKSGEVGELEFKTYVNSDIQNELYEENLLNQSESIDIEMERLRQVAEASRMKGANLMEASIQNNKPHLGNSPNVVGYDNAYNEDNFIPEELVDFAADLNEEDKVYLAMKWGRYYQPNEWVELEKKYNEMVESFDISDSDTEGTLIVICKTFLKMNQAIDAGDMDAFQKLSRVYDQLRKSSKFTAAQNKEANVDFVDSVGELVAYCEKNGGAIPKHEIDVNYDIVDKIIDDLKRYNKSLIYEDKALAHQIEEYIKKRELTEFRKKEGLDEDEFEDENQITDEEFLEHFQQVEEYKEEDELTIEKEKGEVE